MDILADLLTVSRVLLVLYMLYVGLSWGEEKLLLIVTLTALAWITDILDGNFARRTDHPTRLGSFDLVADLSLALVLSTCMILWDFIPLLPAVVIWVLAGAAARLTHGPAPLQLAMGIVYCTLIITLFKIHPLWGWTLVVGLGFLAVLNRRRFYQLASDFLDQITHIFLKI